MTLLERDPKSPPTWNGNLPVTNRYTYGLAGDRFFRTLKEEGRILGTHCKKCNRIYVPATTFCERCLIELDEWVDVGTVGTVHTFTLLYENYDGSPREYPEIIAMIKLGDGGIIQRLGEVDIQDISIGMKVAAVLKPPIERTGSILDISYFRPY